MAVTYSGPSQNAERRPLPSVRLLWLDLGNGELVPTLGTLVPVWKWNAIAGPRFYWPLFLSLNRL